MAEQKDINDEFHSIVSLHKEKPLYQVSTCKLDCSHEGEYYDTYGLNPEVTPRFYEDLLKSDSISLLSLFFL
jgi:hypothetical protein